MRDWTAQDIILLILYITGALFLIFTAYRIYIKRFIRNKLQALNDVQLITSEKDIYSGNSQFLIISPEEDTIKFSLLDSNENEVTILKEGTLKGEIHVNFNATDFEAGNYFLLLETTNSRILRKIAIIK